MLFLLPSFYHDVAELQKGKTMRVLEESPQRAIKNKDVLNSRMWKQLVGKVP